MAERIILLSGAISSGKSTLGKSIVGADQSAIFRTRDVLQLNVGPAAASDRRALQSEGDRLDRETKQLWVLEEFKTWRSRAPRPSTLVVDSVRTLGQVRSFRDEYGPLITHVHLTAPVKILEHRYVDRQKGASGKTYPFPEVRANPTEQHIEELGGVADLVVDTNRCTAEDVLTRTASHLGVRPSAGMGYVDVLVGGQYGSEGKGQIADFVSREYDILIRVGGPNAGHSVFREPAPYVFHHLPSGTLSSGAKLLIGPGAVLRVPVLLKEIRECQVKPGRLTIDAGAMVISDDDVERESKLKADIGSTGQGVGAATARRIMERGQPVTFARDVEELRPYIGSARKVLQDSFVRGARALLEGTQGSGLSLFHGTYPYVNSRDTNVMGCLSEAGIPHSRVRRVVMVCRTYPIRVENPSDGTSGPLREITYGELASRSGIDEAELRGTEKTSTTRRQRRLGEFEWDQLQRAAELNSPTDLAITFSDYLDKRNRQAIRFEQLMPDTISFIQEVERVTGTPASLIATGFNNRSVIDRRAW
jgi:adenylosuccinate synthase